MISLIRLSAWRERDRERERERTSEARSASERVRACERTSAEINTHRDGLPPIDQPVVVRQREVHHRPGNHLSVDDSRALLDAMHA